MLQQRIHAILKTIAEETYPGQIKPFTTNVYAKEMSGRHGDYHPTTGVIRIFNLSRPTPYIIATAIHEVGHHCEQCIHGSTGHQKTFYACLRDLLASAIRRGFIDYNVARTLTDARDLQQLEKHFGDVLTKYRALSQEDGMHLVKAKNAFSVKDALKARGYRWSELELAWCKEVPREAAEAELQYLGTVLPAGSFSSTESRSAAIEAVYHAIVKGGYSQREQLKARGYIFNGYGFKGGVWVRRIPAQTINEEKSFLHTHGCGDYKIEGKKTAKK